MLFFSFKGKVLTADISAEKLIVVLKQDRYKSGKHLDYTLMN